MIDAHFVSMFDLSIFGARCFLSGFFSPDKVAILDESTRSGGVGATISALVAEELYDELDAPVRFRNTVPNYLIALDNRIKVLDIWQYRTFDKWQYRTFDMYQMVSNCSWYNAHPCVTIQCTPQTLVERFPYTMHASNYSKNYASRCYHFESTNELRVVSQPTDLPLSPCVTAGEASVHGRRSGAVRVEHGEGGGEAWGRLDRSGHRPRQKRLRILTKPGDIHLT